jgi:hypothetical protein
MHQDQPSGPDQTGAAQPNRQAVARLVAPNGVAPNGVAPNGVAPDGGLPTQPDEAAELTHRIERLPRDVGWLLIYAGMLGVILPGVIGFPLVLAGAAVVTPGGSTRIARWIGRNPPKLVRASIAQIERLLDDLDRRYPPIPPGHDQTSCRRYN